MAASIRWTFSACLICLTFFGEDVLNARVLTELSHPESFQSAEPTSARRMRFFGHQIPRAPLFSLERVFSDAVGIHHHHSYMGLFPQPVVRSLFNSAAFGFSNLVTFSRSALSFLFFSLWKILCGQLSAPSFVVLLNIFSALFPYVFPFPC